MKKLNVAVIFGGRSGEHEVSLVSATSIIKNLDCQKYNIIPIGITKVGEWAIENQKSKIKNQKLIDLFKQKKNIRGSRLPPKILTKIDVAFPILHGTFGEDGTIQGLFEMMNIPYVGAGVLGSAVGMDKIIQKKILRYEKLPTVNFEVYRSPTSFYRSRTTIDNILRRLKFPVFVKPANMGSSVGISKAHNLKELKIALKLAKKYDDKIIIEKAVPNTREFECSILGNENPRASCVGEIVASNEFYDYNAKYVDGKSKMLIPAPISKKLSKKIQDLAIRSYKAINCEGMARVDFLYDTKKDRIYINELNTIPGFTQISMYPKLWVHSGLKYSKLLDELIRLAIERHKNKQKLSITYKPNKKWYK